MIQVMTQVPFAPEISRGILPNESSIKQIVKADYDHMTSHNRLNSEENFEVGDERLQNAVR
jgi:hypothetical protein